MNIGSTKCEDMFDSIYAAVSHIPYGKVASYGLVARAAGLTPSSARVVGWALRVLPSTTSVPWQRVVAKDGRLTIRGSWVGPNDQAEALEKEGIELISDSQSYKVLPPYFVNVEEYCPQEK